MEDQSDNKKDVPHDILKWIIVGLLVVIALGLAFGLGILIGERKAKFSYLWSEKYHTMFAGPSVGFFSELKRFPHGRFIEVHGNFGQILEIKGDEFVIKGKDDLEKVILVTEKTFIQKAREKVKKENLKVGDWIVVIGSPREDGKIEAKLIRIFPQELMLFKPRKFPFF